MTAEEQIQQAMSMTTDPAVISALQSQLAQLRQSQNQTVSGQGSVTTPSGSEVEVYGTTPYDIVVKQPEIPPTQPEQPNVITTPSGSEVEVYGTTPYDIVVTPPEKPITKPTPQPDIVVEDVGKKLTPQDIQAQAFEDYAKANNMTVQQVIDLWRKAHPQYDIQAMMQDPKWKENFDTLVKKYMDDYGISKKEAEEYAYSILFQNVTYPTAKELGLTDEQYASLMSPLMQGTMQVSKEALRQLKESDPEGYRLLTESGMDAYNVYLKNKQQYAIDKGWINSDGTLNLLNIGKSGLSIKELNIYGLNLDTHTYNEAVNSYNTYQAYQQQIKIWYDSLPEDLKTRYDSAIALVNQGVGSQESVIASISQSWILRNKQELEKWYNSLPDDLKSRYDNAMQLVNQGTGSQESVVSSINKIQQDRYDSYISSIKVLEDGGYGSYAKDDYWGVTPSAKIKDGLSEIDWSKSVEVPRVYDVEKYLIDNSTDFKIKPEAISVVNNLFISNPDIADDYINRAQAQLEYNKSIIDYTQKVISGEIDDWAYNQTISNQAKLSGLIEKYGLLNNPQKTGVFQSGDVLLGKESYIIVDYKKFWDSLSDDEKLKLADSIASDPNKSSPFAAFMQTINIDYEQLPLAGKIFLFALPSPFALPVFAGQAVGGVVSPYTVSNKSIQKQIDNNKALLSQGKSSNVNDAEYLLKALKNNSIDAENGNPYDVYNTLSDEQKNKVAIDFTRQQLGLSVSTMDKIMAGAMVAVSAMPAFGSFASKISGTLGKVAKGTVTGLGMGSTALFIGTSIPTLINPDTKLDDKIIALLLDITMAHGLGKTIGVNDLAKSVGQSVKSIITGNEISPRAVTLSKYDILRLRVPPEFFEGIKIEDVQKILDDKTLSPKEQINKVADLLEPTTRSAFLSYIDATNILKDFEAPKEMQRTVAETFSSVEGMTPDKVSKLEALARKYADDLIWKGSLADYAQTKGMSGLKPADFDITIREGSNLTEAQIKSELKSILGDSVEFDVHIESFAKTDYPYGWSKLNPVKVDGILFQSLGEQFMMRARQIVSPGVGEAKGLMGAKLAYEYEKNPQKYEGELTISGKKYPGYGTYAGRIKDINRWHIEAKAVIDNLRANGKNNLADKLDADLKIVDDYQKLSIQKLIKDLPAAEQEKIMEEFLGSPEDFRGIFAKAQVEALKYWESGGKGDYVYKTELGELTIKPTPIEKVVPGTLFTVVDNVNNFVNSLKLTGKVTSGDISELKSKELTIPDNQEYKRQVYQTEDGATALDEMSLSGGKILLDINNNPVMSESGYVKVLMPNGKELWIKGNEAGVIARTIASGIDAGKWIKENYEVNKSNLELYTSDELAYDYLVAKFGGADKIPPEAGIVLIRTNPSSDIGLSDSGKLISSVKKIEYDATSDGKKPVVLNEFTVRNGGELYPTEITSLSEKYDIPTGVLETKDPRTGRVYKVIGLTTNSARSEGKGYVPTASQLRTASWMALKGTFSDLLHPHSPKDIIFTDGTTAATIRSSLADLFYQDKAKFKVDEELLSDKTIRDNVIKEDESWTSKAIESLKKKLSEFNNDENGFLRLYGEKEYNLVKEFFEAKDSTTYDSIVEREKDNLREKEIKELISKNKEIKDYIDKVSPETMSRVLAINLSDLIKPFAIISDSPVSDIQEATNLTNLNTIGVPNTGSYSILPSISIGVPTVSTISATEKVSGIGTLGEGTSTGVKTVSLGETVKTGETLQSETVIPSKGTEIITTPTVPTVPTVPKPLSAPPTPPTSPTPPITPPITPPSTPPKTPAKGVIIEQEPFDREKIMGVYKGRVAWYQGRLRQGTQLKEQWYLITPPYKSVNDITRMFERPQGAYAVKGIGAAFKTVQTLTGEVPSFMLNIDWGYFDLAVTKPAKVGDKPALKFRKDIGSTTSMPINVRQIKTVR